ncbi:MAG: hypothetical protein HKN25_05705 [Pyrinomonadaceae bacterium]|nr:hypothetical protein [Pyrinomonadaceae bacterium]
MSFQTEIYPYRNDRSQFPRRLLAKVDAEFTEIVSVAGRGRRQLGGSRCHWSFNHGEGAWYGGGQTRQVCDFSATLTDKKVVKALLKGWAREISDRYLDYRLINNTFGSRRFESRRNAYETIRQNAPAGAVKFLYNELPGNSRFNLFGNSIAQDMDYNTYFSTLLAWDDLHCFGLVMEISRLNNLLQLGGGGAVHLSLQASSMWISNAQSNSGNVYNFVSS